jgi:hypothetical protein
MPFNKLTISYCPSQQPAYSQPQQSKEFNICRHEVLELRADARIVRLEDSGQLAPGHNSQCQKHYHFAKQQTQLSPNSESSHFTRN